MHRLPSICLLTFLLASGCEDERDRLRAENDLHRSHVETLAAENAALLRTQSASLTELQAERERSAQVQAEDRVLRGHRDLAAAIMVLLACSLAASLYGLARRGGAPHVRPPR